MGKRHALLTIAHEQTIAFTDFGFVFSLFPAIIRVARIKLAGSVLCNIIPTSLNFNLESRFTIKNQISFTSIPVTQ